MNAVRKPDPFAMGIKRIIHEKGLKQGVVAKRAGYTDQQLCDMINNRRIIKAVDLVNLATALEVEMSSIYDAGREQV